MTRLIDADALTNELIKGIEEDTDKSIQSSLAKSVCMLICKAIEQQPTIDAVPINWLIRMRNKHKNDGFAWIYEAVIEDWRKEHDKTD